MIDLDALVSPDRLPKVRLFGREVVVRPLTGAAAHRIAVTSESDPNGTGMLGVLLETARGVVPELTADEAAQLSVEQLSALIQLSRGQVDEVEQMVAERAEKN